MALNCPSGPNATGAGSAIIAQQLFLGASINSFNTNLGWGGSPSTLNVDLVNDFGSLGKCNISNNTNLDIFQIKSDYGTYDADNHYYDCIGNNCYVDERGFPYDPTREETIPDRPDVAQPSKERRVPGKVYHVLTSNGLVSRYWRKHDPGFFGAGTLLDINGNFKPRYYPNNTFPFVNNKLFPYKYNIIGVPVIFRYGYFTFGGIVTSWDATINGVPIGTSSFDIFNTSVSYRVTITSADILLDSCKVILNEYAGSIFCSLGSSIGGPTNYIGSKGKYTGLLKDGNIPNVFNIYGFLESFGFGTSQKNNEGIPLAYALDALTTLTSTAAPLGAKHAFSPFGRIIAPIPLTDAIDPTDPFYGKPTNTDFGLNSFGILNQSLDNTGTSRIQLALDLSEIPRPPTDIRIGGNMAIMSITDFIRYACEKTNRDFYITIVPKNGINFIKVKTTYRGSVVPVNSIETTVKSITDSGIPVTQSSFGQTESKTKSRVILIGANQKRLYQAKSFLLGYSNAHLVYHPVLKQFIDYYRFGKDSEDSKDSKDSEDNTEQQSESTSTDTYSAEPTDGDVSQRSNSRAQQSPNAKSNDEKINIFLTGDKKFVDSIRIPLSYSTRNIKLCSSVNGKLLTAIWSNEQKLGPSLGKNGKKLEDRESQKDIGASDAPVGGKVIPTIGNYHPAAVYKMKSFVDSLNNNTSNNLDQTNPGDNKPPLGKGEAEFAPDPRYLPLYKYSISPFFGFINDFQIPQDVGPYHNRFVRPVYFDTVTGQIIVMCGADELPILTLGKLFPPLFEKRPAAATTGTFVSALPNSGTMDSEKDDKASNQPKNGTTGNNNATNVEHPKPSDGDASGSSSSSETGRDPINIDPKTLMKRIPPPAFGVTESEMRAAAEGVETYLVYCLAKLDFSKPDLFLMLIRSYLLAGQSIFVEPNIGNIDKAASLMPSEMSSAATSNPSATNIGDPALGAGVTTGNADIVSFPDLLNLNFNYIINYDFLNDLTRLQGFIKSLHDTYYGKKYAVSLPAMSTYRDRQYVDIQIKAGSDNIGVYQGSGKLFYNYELSSDGAWEEFGNYIDDSLVVGSPNYYTFIDDNNLIQPIIGYNATPIKDYATEAWCKLNPEQKNKELQKAYRLAIPDQINKNDETSKRTCSFIQKSFELSSLTRYMSCDKAVTASLDLSGISDSDPYILVNTKDAAREDAYGKKLMGSIEDPCQKESKEIEIKSQKLYIKTSCDKDIVFYDPLSLALPKAVIISPGIDLALSSNSYREDPSKTVLSTVSVEDLAIIIYFEKYGEPMSQDSEAEVYALIASSTEKFNLNPKMKLPDATLKELKDFGVLDEKCEDKNALCFSDYESLANALNGKSGKNKQGEARLRILKYLLQKQIVPMTSDKFLIPAPSASAQSITHYMLAPKKANPVFAAVPIQDNLACYGPWTNYPALDDQSYAFAGITETKDLVEQLISDTHIDKQETWAPWEYGGMAFLDRKMIYEIDAITSFQTRTESGEFTIPGLPIFSMGGNLIIKKTDQDINRRIIKTWFSFPYHALTFENGYENLKNYAGLTLSDLRLSVGGGNISTTYSFRTYSAKRGLYNKENSDKLQRLALNSFSLAKSISDTKLAIQQSIRKQMTALIKEYRAGMTYTDISKYKSKLYGTSPSTFIIGKAKHYWPLGDYSKDNSATDKSVENLRWEKSRFDAWAGLYETREALNELTYNYSSQAGMSFDALYSPISFYPTPKNGTYAISSRCITEDNQNKNIICPGCYNKFYVEVQSTQYPCPLCQKSKIFPPSVIDNQNTNTDDADKPSVNFLSLNPIIMPTGDFLNPNSQPKISGERGRHNISFIVRDESHIINRNILINNNLTKFEDSDTDPNPDWSDIDIVYKEDYKANILNNYRFFSFRGPMMLHGWGYDTEGYPVPNAADEPKELDADGRPKRFFLTTSGTNDLTRDGDFLPTASQQLGDIIGKGWEKEGGEWVRKPSNKFYLNWGERADLWPIGPIDLRWDYERKVWVGGGGGDGGCSNADPPYIIASGVDSSTLSQFIINSNKKNKNCSYKMVYGVLEEDLVKLDNHIESSPTRAFLDDLEYALKPLPENIRRLIYVVDRTGYTAPRGAKILLRYNNDTGFYEPVSKQQYIVFGLLNSNGTATVELSYMPGYKSGDFTYKTTIPFINPLGLSSSKSQNSGSAKGLFMYDNSRWNLISIE